MNDLVLGIDVGTTAVKAVLFDVEGKPQGIGQVEYPTHILRAGWVEQNPDDWWEATCGAIAGATATVSDAAERVAAVSVSAQAPTMIPLNGHRQPVRPAMIWMDRRADAEAQELADLMQEEGLFAVTGNRPDPYYVAAKIRWLYRHEPEFLAQTEHFVQINGYINLRLTGELTLDYSHAGLLQLWDIGSGKWSDKLLEACGVTERHFPEPRTGHHVCGEVTPTAAVETGLRAGTPVVVGTVDGAAAALEAGVVEAGVAAEMTGTSTVMIMPTAAGNRHESLIYMPHALDGVHLLLAAMVASGASLRWFRDEFGGGETFMAERLNLDVYDLMAQQADDVDVGSDGVIFLPYMMGERSPIWNSNARGVFFGMSLKTTRGAVIRAVLEGVAFAMRHNMEVANTAGVSFHEVRSVGGGSQSALWNQIKADVLGVPVLVPEISVGAPFGDAILAGMGAGWYDNPRDVIQQSVRIRERYVPDRERTERYAEIYPLFRSLYESLHPNFDSAAAIFG